MPCDFHYTRAKEVYGRILQNIGCICKILRSLNLDSCCVPSQAGSIRSNQSSGSSQQESTRKTPSPLNAPSPCKPQKCDNGAKKSCCSHTPVDNTEINTSAPSKCKAPVKSAAHLANQITPHGHQENGEVLSHDDCCKTTRMTTSSISETFMTPVKKTTPANQAKIRLAVARLQTILTPSSLKRRIIRTTRSTILIYPQFQHLRHPSKITWSPWQRTYQVDALENGFGIVTDHHCAHTCLGSSSGA